MFSLSLFTQRGDIARGGRFEGCGKCLRGAENGKQVIYDAEPRKGAGLPYVPV